MTVFETINKAKAEARKKNVQLFNYEIKRLMSYVLDISIAEIVVGGRYINITKEQYNNFMKYIEELLNGKPLQYITRKQHFMGLEFYVDERVLIPQPDTEVLVEQAIKIIEKMKGSIRVLDLCTGSGAIAIALKHMLGDKVQITASDVSEDALNVAKKNCTNILGKENKIEFVKSNMFEDINEEYNVIVSNPPYIKTGVIETLPIDVQNEPHIALDGGKDGLDFYKTIKHDIQKCLLLNGYLLLEIGFDQKKELLELFPTAKCIKDYTDNDRVIIYKYKK